MPKARPKEDPAEREERCYIEGHRRAVLSMLQHCLSEFGAKDPETGRTAWLLERQEAVAALRSLCAEHGDNDWPDDLRLADVIDKHLAPYVKG